MKKELFLVFLIIIFGTIDAFAEKSYHLEIDNHEYDLEYDVDADVIAMELDQELTSLLIGIENTRESQFSINLPNEMISAENNEFAVLVDGYEVDYSINPLNSKTQIVFFVNEGTQEVEIIGTHVIPEFPAAGLLFGVLLVMPIILLFSKNSSLWFR